jgi:glutathione-independent formaldehyde dehydrogenase
MACVGLSDVPDPKIGRPNDAIVQITRTNICGSDLHMDQGNPDALSLITRHDTRR